MRSRNSLRSCLLAPIPELVTAIRFLDRAAKDIISGNLASARDFIIQANVPEVWQYARRVMGKYDDDIHRYRRSRPDMPPLSRSRRIKVRMPSPAQTMDIYRRDGFHCRYCEMPVILPTARVVMMAIAPDALLWPAKDDEKHAAFYALTAVVDHLVPHARGGTNDPDNLVTSCQSCNYGKGNYLIAELDLMDPRERPPIVDALDGASDNPWDGLERLLYLARQGSDTLDASVASTAEPVDATPPGAAANPAEVSNPPSARWQGLNAVHPQHAAALGHLLMRCEAAGVTWHLRKSLILRMRTATSVLDIVGINADGSVEIPWSLGGHKEAYQVFVERLKATISGTEIYRTEKGWWRIKKDGRKLTLEALLDAADGLILGIVDLRAAIIDERRE